MTRWQQARGVCGREPEHGLLGPLVRAKGGGGGRKVEPEELVFEQHRTLRKKTKDSPQTLQQLLIPLSHRVRKRDPHARRVRLPVVPERALRVVRVPPPYIPVSIRVVDL